MKLFWVWGLVPLASGCHATEVRPSKERFLDVTYVANEGFLIESAGRKVLVDALFGDDEINWCHVPSSETREHLAAASAPFAGVNLVLVSHRHVDHFNSGLVLAHLKSNPDARLVAPREAVLRLREDPAWSPHFEGQIEEIALELYETKSLSSDGIGLDVHRVRHGFYPDEDPETGEIRNRHETVEQLVFVLELGGARIVHLGDAFLHENREFFESERFSAPAIDLVFLEGLTTESLAILEQRLAPQHVVMMHLPQDPETIDRIAGSLAEAVPAAVVFRSRMQGRRFVISREEPGFVSR
ncbi:MAG: MBL fold metallo-hydrolase [Planctomycetota bacterium]